MKVEINKRRKMEKFINIWKINNTFLQNKQIKEKIKRGPGTVTHVYNPSCSGGISGRTMVQVSPQKKQKYDSKNN
jgi:hypothetical protein